MTIRFATVTTCNLAGWDRYAARMVDSFDRLWPKDVPLIVYSEDDLPMDGVCDLPAWLDEFKLRHRNNPDARGRGTGSYNYTRDCIRFAHKVGAVTDAAMKYPADVLIWMDADTLTHAPVTTEWLASLMPADCYIGWLDRERLYPECGFYMLSMKHPAHEKIMSRWVALYESDEVLQMPETHDCVTLQKVICEAEAAGEIKVHSLSGERGRKTAHPLCNSLRLAECLDHLKGARKDKGRSHASDLIGKRQESYWQ